MTARQNGRTWRLVPEVGLRGEFAEFETVEWLRSVLKPGALAIDIGANVGQMTLEMAELVGPVGRVLAVEPAEGNLQVLRQHIAANGFTDRVVIVPAACSERSGETVEMTVFGADAGAVGSGHTLARSPGVAAERARHLHVTVQVPTVSVDGLCAEQRFVPEVIKIDVEGAELEVLRGARETLRKCRPLLRVGFHPFAFPDPAFASDEFRRLLDECGYDLADPLAPATLELAEYCAAPRTASGPFSDSRS
jgi:FkbM family methyltransferase